MSELIIKKDAYQKYVEQAEKYTQPLPFKKWLDDILNLKFGC